MALERFIPKSPDPFIRNSQDFEVAKFGHLNTIIEYVNSYVVTDSLQLAGLGPITSTARYISDSTGVNSAISISTTRVGIGTDTPTSELHIDGHSGFGASLKITTNKVGGVAYVQMISDYVTGFEQYQYGGPGWGWPNWTTTRAGGTAAAPTAVPSNYGLNEYSFWGYDGTGGGQAYSMMTRTSEAWTTTGHGIYTTFNTVATGSTALVERMRFTGSGNITFNNASDTAKVAIKGTGSTSATTSLLVQNSSASELFKIQDNGQVGIGSVFGGWKLNVQGDLRANRIDLYGSTGSGHAMVKIDDNGTLMRNNTFAIDAATGNAGQGANLAVGAYFNTLARLYVLGSGSTSATTSLLVQNSLGITALAVRDDSRTYFVVGGGGSLLVGNSNPNQNVIQLAGYFSEDSNAAMTFENYNNGTLKVYVGGAFFGVTTDLSQTFSNGSRGGIGMRVSGTINNTGSSTGNIGGYTFEPNITSLTGGSLLYAFNSTIGGAYFNTSSRQASAILQADSTMQGFLPPRMTTVQKNAIATPSAGLVVFDTTLNKLCVYTTAWQTITSV